MRWFKITRQPQFVFNTPNDLKKYAVGFSPRKLGFQKQELGFWPTLPLGGWDDFFTRYWMGKHLSFFFYLFLHSLMDIKEVMNKYRKNGQFYSTKLYFTDTTIGLPGIKAPNVEV